MGLFDFIKKKEFEKIRLLQEKLEKFKPITNIQIIIDNKNVELDLLIQNKTIAISEKDNELKKLISDKKIELDATIANKKNELDLIKQTKSNEISEKDNELKKLISDKKIELDATIENKKNKLDLIIQTKTNEIFEKDNELKKLISDKKFDLDAIIENKKNELELIIHTKTKEISEKENELKKIITDKEEDLNSTIENKNQAISYIQKDLDELNVKYELAFETYTKIRKDLNLYESKLDLIEYGIYEPLYNFEKSEDYRNEQNRIIEEQKTMIQMSTAAICNTTWYINDSKTKGSASTKKIVKLVLRAFNGECNSLITKVKWNNINQIVERLKKSYDAINKLGQSYDVTITEDFLYAKLKEIVLEYEFQTKKQEEKEEMRAIQDELREDNKVRKEYEQAQRKAEQEEEMYEKALLKARKEAENATGLSKEELTTKILDLERELLLSQEKKERAISMAQLTKRGHVYIISNIGSFGENVYKIGMTRRLEPNDRVSELGGASVPFKFDVHAMIYSDEARTLENELHKAFTNKKVNMQNYRKEFFNVSLDEIENKIKELGFEAEFTIFPEAMQYRETKAVLAKINSQEQIKTIEEIIAEEYPNSLN